PQVDVDIHQLLRRERRIFPGQKPVHQIQFLSPAFAAFVARNQCNDKIVLARGRPGFRTVIDDLNHCGGVQTVAPAAPSTDRTKNLARGQGIISAKVISLFIPEKRVYASSASLPIPLPEQVGNGILESWQELFAVERGAGTEDGALGEVMADLDESLVRMDDPGDLRAAGEEIFEARVEFHPSVCWGENLHCQIRS